MHLKDMLVLLSAASVFFHPIQSLVVHRTAATLARSIREDSVEFAEMGLSFLSPTSLIFMYGNIRLTAKTVKQSPSSGSDGCLG